MLALIKAAMGGAKLWLLLAIAGVGFVAGGAVTWKVASWSAKAEYADALKGCVGASKAALNEERTAHTAQLAEIDKSIAAVAEKDAVTNADVEVVLTKVGGIYNAMRALERSTNLAVGRCNLSADGDRLRDATYRAAFPSVGPAGTGAGEAGGADDADAPAARADSGEWVDGRRAG